MTPQSQLRDYEPDLSKLSPAQRDAFEAVYQRGMCAREYARQNDLAWGTVSNHLMRAREKLACFGSGQRV